MSATEVATILLSQFNAASRSDAMAMVQHWCAAPRWAGAVCESRPFASITALREITTKLWGEADNNDLLAAFSAHPVIGDVELLRTKYASTANAEQGQVLQANEATIQQLASQNLAYRKRHGFTFIVFATGKSAEQMLELLNQRIGNSTPDEMRNATAEQLKIMQLRLQQTIASHSHE